MNDVQAANRAPVATGPAATVSDAAQNAGTARVELYPTAFIDEGTMFLNGQPVTIEGLTPPSWRP